MEKVIRNGQVAILYSPGWGAGWSTWNSDADGCMFDPAIVECVEKGMFDLIPDLAHTKYGDGFYAGGAEQLTVAWVDEGASYLITEYDGNETLHTEFEVA